MTQRNDTSHLETHDVLRTADGAELAPRYSGSGWRAGRILAAFMALTVPLMPLQAVFVRFSPRLARWFPHWYHRQVCRIVGVRLNIDGAVAQDRPVLLIANHTSWLDIPVLSAVAPISFVAKKEVGSWPFVSSLARLQRTVFVDRQRRLDVDQTTTEITRRLAQGDTVVLFAEGTSSDGNRVLPFKTSLFAAAKPPVKRRAVNGSNVEGATGTDAKNTAVGNSAPSSRAANKPPVVQTLSLVYTKLHGIPISRGERSLVGWYGDMEMHGHAWGLLKVGPLDADIRISPPVPLDDFADRKALAFASEETVRRNVVAALRGLPPGTHVDVREPDRKEERHVVQQGAASGEKWR